MQDNIKSVEYDYTIAKLFVYTTLLFGIVGMLIGVIIALQMAFPDLNYLAGEYGTFGRLRPIHTNGVIYGFTLSGIWAGWYYFGQRVFKISYAEHPFLKFIGLAHFGVYMLVMILAVITLLGGLTQSKEYAELIWPLDLLVVVTWVLWGVSLFGSMGVRRKRQFMLLCGISLRHLSESQHFISSITSQSQHIL